MLQSVGPAALARIEPYFHAANISYPPREVVLLVTKDDRKLEVWARDTGPFRQVKRYAIKNASGTKGPKLREGDGQVPEGRYRIEALNPNSAYHLSIKLNYPNWFDLWRAKEEGRTAPGSNIFIHGKASSRGCLAMGDPTIEELFVLVEQVGVHNVTVVIAPSDPRKARLTFDAKRLPAWTSELYRQITHEFAKYPHRALSPPRPIAIQSPRSMPSRMADAARSSSKVSNPVKINR